MTTILKALRELERQGATSGRPIPSIPDGAAARRWLPVVFAVAGLVIAGLVVGFLSAQRPPPQIDIAPTQDPAAQPAPRSDSAAVAAIPEEAPPWGQLLPDTPAARPAPPAKSRPAAAVPPAVAAVHPHPGEPRVEVRSIAYDPNSAKRAVTLLIDGRAVRLREGESSGDTEVQLILRDTVYVRCRGSVFAASPQR